MLQSPSWMQQRILGFRSSNELLFITDLIATQWLSYISRGKRNVKEKGFYYK